MAANVASINSILKRVYKSPIQRAINDEVWAYKLFKMRSDLWSGDTWEQPVHVSRNSGVGNRLEGGILPTAGNQGYALLRGGEKSTYGRFEVTGQAKAKARGANSGAFANVMSEEMERLPKDVANLLNRLSVSGGFAIGWLNQRRPSLVSAGALGDASATQSWQFQGDFTALAQATAADITSWVRVRLFRTDTLQEITCANSGTTATTGDIFVAGIDQDKTAPTVDLRAVATAAAAADFNTLTTLVGGAPVNVADFAPILVVLHDVASTAVTGGVTYGSGTGLPVSGALGGPAAQQVGIFGNLGLATHFTVDRTTATGTADILQAHCVTASKVAAGDRVDMTVEMIQDVFDTLSDEEGVTPDIILTNAHQRTKYLGLMIGTFGAAGAANARFNVDGNKVGKMDLGPDQGGWAYSNIPFQVTRHYPNGGMTFLKTSDWFRPTLLEGTFADDDGNILSRTANADVWEGFWKQYDEIACKLPNHQAHLTGLNTV